MRFSACLSACLSVRMTTLISETIKTKAFKFRLNICYYIMHVKFVLELANAPLNPCKSIKTDFPALFQFRTIQYTEFSLYLFSFPFAKN